VLIGPCGCGGQALSRLKRQEALHLFLGLGREMLFGDYGDYLMPLGALGMGDSV